MLRSFVNVGVVFFLLMLVCSNSAAGDFVVFKLTLADYRLGMTYEDAVSIRPFDYIEETGKGLDSRGSFNAFAGGVFLDDIETNLLVRFEDNKIVKVISRISPFEVKKITETFQLSLGKGVGSSRDLYLSGYGTFQQSTIRWDFPNSSLHVVNSTSTESATISLILKKPKTEKE